MYAPPWIMPHMGMPGSMPLPGMPMGMPGSLPLMGGFPPPMMATPAPTTKAGSSQQNGSHDESRNAKTRDRRRLKGKGGRDGELMPDPLSEEAILNRSDNLAEVYKTNLKSRLTLTEILPNLAEFMQDQQGIRFIQMKLDETNQQERCNFITAILPEAAKYANNVWGNAVVQKLLEIGTADQRRQLVQVLLPDLFRLSIETYGCRVVQKAIQNAPKESQQAIAAQLGENVAECIHSMHGNHVIQKCVEQMPPDSVTFIIKAIEGDAEKMASHMYGCRVVQRLLEHCAAHQLEVMLDALLDVVPKLAQDPYGNYVVQHMLEHGRKEDKSRILKIIQGNIVMLSKHKCSSNVVEKALEIATVGEHAGALEAERALLMRTVLGSSTDVNPPLRQMMDDRFGNYIVQRMIEHSRGPERELIRQQLQNAEHMLRNSSNGRHILAALNREFVTVVQ